MEDTAYTYLLRIIYPCRDITNWSFGQLFARRMVIEITNYFNVDSHFTGLHLALSGKSGPAQEWRSRHVFILRAVLRPPLGAFKKNP